MELEAKSSGNRGLWLLIAAGMSQFIVCAGLVVGLDRIATDGA